MRLASVGLALLLALSACSATPPRELTQAEADAGWQSAAAKDVGLSPAALDRLRNAAAALPFAHSLLVVKNGCIVAEDYFNGYSRDRPQELSSIAKAVISALVGIAIDQGLFQGPAQPIVQLLPARLQALAGPDKGRITLADLMTMRTGLASTDIDVHHFAWRWDDDPAALSLRQDFIAEPGKTFRYSTGNVHLLSVALTERSGMPTSVYAERNLFGPAGIAYSKWGKDNAGYDFGGIEIEMTPRNLARFAYLYAHGGRLGGRQVIPAGWIEESTRPRLDTGADGQYFKYGFLWWWMEIEGVPVYAARGWGAQTILVLPDLDLLLLTTGDWLVTGDRALRNATGYRALLVDYIRSELPVLKASSGPNARRCPLGPVR
jgi:CubicO group peptidase (beta-lactamase class C family)